MKDSTFTTFSHSDSQRRVRSGFTLVELILGIGIVSILSSIIFFAVGKTSERADMARELGAGRKLIAAYLLYPLDHGGRLMPGMEMRPNAPRVEFRGQRVTGEAAERYPLRLLPYLDDALEGSIIASRNGEQIKNDPNLSRMGAYSYSMLPSFGMNSMLVGGIVDDPDPNLWLSVTRKEALTRQSQADVNLIVFATAGNSGIIGSGEIAEGFFRVSPPRTAGGGWDGATWKSRGNPARYGNLDARHNRQVVVAFLDGNVELYSIKNLGDMRLWSRNAALNNDPNYVVVP